MRPHEDYMVDRMEVEVLQGIKLTITNKSIGLTFLFLGKEMVNEIETTSLVWKNFERLSYNKWLCSRALDIFLGGYREVETPDPIPNSAVKHFFADGTIRKSREE